MNTRVRIRDVAKLAGVSTATVSRVLANPDIVKADKQGAVLDAVEKLGYVPDATARALSSGRTYTVGCVVPSLDQSTFAASTQALQATLLQHGYQLLIASHDYNLYTEGQSIRSLMQRGVDALVLVGADHLDATWDTLLSWGKPTLLNGSCDPRLPSIGFDNQALGRAMAEHLLSLGHTCLGVITGPTAHNDRARARLEGMKSAIAARGLAIPEAYFTEQTLQLSGGRLGLDYLMGLPKRPTAVFCIDDLLAAGALLHAQRLGLAVPRDLSISGVGNQPVASELVPGLTTIHLPNADLGRITANQIFAALAGHPPAKQFLLPYELLVRGSTGPCIAIN